MWLNPFRYNVSDNEPMIVLSKRMYLRMLTFTAIVGAGIVTVIGLALTSGSCKPW